MRACNLWMKFMTLSQQVQNGLSVRSCAEGLAGRCERCECGAGRTGVGRPPADLQGAGWPSLCARFTPEKSAPL